MRRLAQASTLFAMRAPGCLRRPVFNRPGRTPCCIANTPGAPIAAFPQPDNSFTLDQWKVKQNFALQASMASHQLLAAALPRHDDPANHDRCLQHHSMAAPGCGRPSTRPFRRNDGPLVGRKRQGNSIATPDFRRTGFSGEERPSFWRQTLSSGRRATRARPWRTRARQRSLRPTISESK